MYMYEVLSPNAWPRASIGEDHGLVCLPFGKDLSFKLSLELEKMSLWS